MEIDFQRILFMIPPLLLALTAHECAHAWVAWRLGDNTAYMMGRVTLNPVKHLDPIGTLAIFVTGMFGWAKPVPVNARNFKHPAKDLMLVSIAGPATNLFLAAVFAVIYKIAINNVDPSMLFATSGLVGPLFKMVLISIWLNVGLAVFNMLPIHPLDGSSVLAYFLPTKAYIQFRKLEPYGFMILLALIMTGMTGTIIGPAVVGVVRFLTGGMI